MKVLLILLAVAATAWADCDSSFGAYLNALKDEIGKNVKPLEEENRDDYYKLVRQCFADSSDDGSKCTLPDSQLKGDVYGDSGPMQGCTRCQNMAKGLRDKYMGSKEEVRKCFRTHLAQAVREELEPCIQGKISNGYNFKVPPIPDFDESTFANIDIAETAVNYRIEARSRLDACSSVNPSKFATTNPCMQKGYPGIFAKHCQAAKNAKSKAVTSDCNARFGEVKTATCDCMDSKRGEWHEKFAKVKEVVDTATTASECGTRISDQLGAWLGKIQSALNDCLPKDASTSGQKTDLRTLIDLGCGQILNGGVKKNELTTGFRFVRLFLDALNDRITMYCDKNCAF